MRLHPKIYVPKREILVVSEVKPTLRGFFTVERFRGDHRLGIKTGHWEFENLITDAGLNALGAGVLLYSLFQYMGVGTASGAPANGDTALGAEISPSNTNRSNSTGSIVDVIASGPSYAYWSWKRVRLFTELQGNGNLTEIGWFTAATAGTMWTRQLFKDNVGTPTTIVKTSADQLRVTYELRMYPPTVDVTGTKVISGSPYDYLIRASRIDSTSYWGSNGGTIGMLASLGDEVGMQIANAYETDVLGTTQQAPAGSAELRSSASLAAYVTGNFYRDAEYVWEPGVGNFATGVGSVTFWSGWSGAAINVFQESFTPKLPKDNTKRLTLIHRLAWARH